MCLGGCGVWVGGCVGGGGGMHQRAGCGTPACADLLQAGRSGTTRAVFGLVIGVRVSNFGPGRDARAGAWLKCMRAGGVAPEAPRGVVFGFFAPQR